MKLASSASAAVLVTAFLMAATGCQKQEGPAEKAGKEIDKATKQAGDKLDQARKKVGQEMEQAGEKLQDAARRDNK